MRAKRSGKGEEPTDGSRVWNAYADAYRHRYGRDPIRNAKANGQCTQLVKRLGVENAIKVVAFYLTHNKSYYIQRCHMLDPCVGDAEALHTQMDAGHRVTAAEAHQKDVSQSNEQVFAQVLANIQARKGALP